MQRCSLRELQQEFIRKFRRFFAACFFRPSICTIAEIGGLSFCLLWFFVLWWLCSRFCSLLNALLKHKSFFLQYHFVVLAAFFETFYLKGFYAHLAQKTRQPRKSKPNHPISVILLLRQRKNSLERKTPGSNNLNLGCQCEVRSLEFYGCKF